MNTTTLGHGSSADDRMTLAMLAAMALGAVALWPLFDSWEWYPAAVLSAAAVILIGALARALRVPAAVVPIMQGAALLLLTVEAVARGSLWAGAVPTLATITDLQSVIGAGLDSAQTFAPPVPVTAGIVALVMLGVGLTALVLDVCMVTLESPVIAAIPLLSLYVVPVVMVAEGAPWWAFAASAAGWLVLLAADGRAAMLAWGRHLGDSAPPFARGATARRVGLVAIVGALLIPLAVPALAVPFVLGPGPGPGVAGGDGAVIVSPLVSLKRDYLDAGDRTVLTVTGSPESPQYLRMVTLDQFDGQTWTASQPEPSPALEMNQGLPRTVEGLADQGGEVLPYTIRVTDLESQYAPMPQPAVTATIGGGWFYDPRSDSVYSRQFSTRNSVYIVEALADGTDAATLRERTLRGQSQDGGPPEAQPPIEVPAVISQTAQSVTRGAGNAFDQAVALQDWFRSEFRYSTTVRSGSDSAYLEQFLTEKVGYCEQFAATMALMARALGIPSRVAVGFAPGDPTSDGWRVSARDAHAWPELWLPGSGWTRFEPTPRSDAGTAVTTPAYAPGAVPTAPAGPTPSASAAPSGGPQRAGADEEDRSAAADAEAGSTEAATPLWPWVVLALLVAAACIPALVRVARRQRRVRAPDPAERARGAWQEVRDSAVDYGRSWPEAATPRQAERVLVSVTGSAHAVARLRSASEDAVYSAAAASEWDRDPSEVAQDLREVRRGLASGLGPVDRARAVLWPPSVSRSLWSLWTRGTRREG